jgi:hypothetical protein
MCGIALRIPSDEVANKKVSPMTIRVMLTEVLMSTMHLKSLPVAVC